MIQHSSLFVFVLGVLFLGLNPDQFTGTNPESDTLKENRETQIDTFKVMSYNIRHGRGLDDEVDLRRIADDIRDTNADLIGLQEVDMGVERSYQFDLMSVLSGYTGLKSVFYKNIPFQGGEYGNAILSRFPIESSRNLHYIMEHEGEQRGLLQTEVRIGELTIAFMTTHIDYREDDTERLMNVDQMIETKRAYRGMPVLIIGDFNDVPGSNTHERMKEYFTDVWEEHGEGDGYTFHAEDPDRRIDYIFYTNNLVEDDHPAIRPVDIKVIETDASDHLPIIATFVIEWQE